MAEVGTERQSDARLVRLQRAVGRRRRGSGVSADRLLVLIATMAIPLGLVMIVLGWYGASRTPYTFEQIPYIASGGIFGLALVFGGGFLYFGSWVARGVQETRRQGEETRLALARIEEALTGRPVPGMTDTPAGEQIVGEQIVPRPSARAATKVPVSAPASAVVTGNGGGHVRGPFVATARGSTVHAPDCPVVVGREGLRAVDPDDTVDLTPCKLCAPFAT